MPTGGTLTIETSNAQLDPRYATKPDAIAGGQVVMVSVSDTGVGMDAATRERIFEPFFTTKALGKGTGLGLSTVYGIVKQSGGSITVYSQPGQGCTFRIYFPVVTDAGAESTSSAGTTDEPTGDETVLIAEDDAHVRALVRRCLVSRGYIVLEASHGQEALEVATAHNGPIHLLLTDVVMPSLSGRELAERLAVQRPAMRVLFMSGHSEEAIQRHGVLTAASAFLEKPLMPTELGRRVRRVLDAHPAGRGA
jgi:CheY-like chemotaxis protein